MTESKEKLRVIAEDCKAVIEEAKSMGCNKVRALYNIPLENMELIVQALEKQTPKKTKKIEAEGYRYTDTYRCPTCGGNFSGTGIADYCYHCGQKLDWRNEG